MKVIKETVDVVIAGGGTAGHIAALQASRAGIKTSVIEAGSMLGGTMTSGGVYMPNHYFSTEGPVVLGIPWELYTKTMEIERLPIPDYRKRRPVENPGYYSYINVPVYAAVAEPLAWEPTSYGESAFVLLTDGEIVKLNNDELMARLSP